MLGTVLRKLEDRFQGLWRDRSGVALLSHQQREVLQGDLARMEAGVSLQKHNGFKALDELAEELRQGYLNGLEQMDAIRFRGPRGIEQKGIALGIKRARPSRLVDVLVERGATAQRLLNEDNAKRAELAKGRLRVTRA
jgi:hypothetical protein